MEDIFQAISPKLWDDLQKWIVDASYHVRNELLQNMQHLYKGNSFALKIELNISTSSRIPYLQTDSPKAFSISFDWDYVGNKSQVKNMHTFKDQMEDIIKIHKEEQTKYFQDRVHDILMKIDKDAKQKPIGVLHILEHQPDADETNWTWMFVCRTHLVQISLQEGNLVSYKQHIKVLKNHADDFIGRRLANGYQRYPFKTLFLWIGENAKWTYLDGVHATVASKLNMISKIHRLTSNVDVRHNLVQRARYSTVELGLLAHETMKTMGVFTQLPICTLPFLYWFRRHHKIMCKSMCSSVLCTGFVVVITYLQMSTKGGACMHWIIVVINKAWLKKAPHPFLL